MQRAAGFTLVELMVVVGIIAILVGLAMPSYTSSVRKGRRADAQTRIMEFTGEAARVHTEKSSYASLVAPTSTDYYTFSFVGTPTATNYTIRAAPNGAQDQDSCGTMTLTNTGQKTHTGSDPDCWK